MGVLYSIITTWETKVGRLTLFYGGANPPDERKEGDADVCYIFLSDSVINIHCCPCRSLLRDFQG